MRVSFVRPIKELQPYVESIWLLESGQGIPPAARSIAAPNGCPKLIFLCQNTLAAHSNGRTQLNPEGKLYFVGNKIHSTSLWTNRSPTRFIGVEFAPHGAFPFFHTPLSETRDRVWEADTVLRWGRRVEELIDYTGTAEEVTLQLQQELVNQLRRNQIDDRLVAWCVAQLRSTYGRLSIRELECQTGYSRRYLDLLFQKHVGFAPKVLAGILRFQRFYRRWASGQSFDRFKDELYDYYYDQAHFSKEFKRMTGYAPGRFSREVTNEFGRRLSLRDVS
jgi:AraC-like DNA-binding protein